MRANKNRFTDDDMAIIHELLVYSTIEMMRALHIEKTKPVYDDTYIYRNRELDLEHFQTAANPELFQSALGGFGADGARNNRIYSACGLSISLGGENGMSDSPQSVYGGYGIKSDK